MTELVCLFQTKCHWWKYYYSIAFMKGRCLLLGEILYRDIQKYIHCLKQTGASECSASLSSSWRYCLNQIEKSAYREWRACIANYRMGYIALFFDEWLCNKKNKHLKHVFLVIVNFKLKKASFCQEFRAWSVSIRSLYMQYNTTWHLKSKAWEESC